ncbi:tolB protein precursor [Lacihabitans lacunae]|uniref:TolB protein n=1 Tax=Lacihabitans lacunae TaxID=1028214 RepID=A0ABV7YTI1_9BACT
MNKTLFWLVLFSLNCFGQSQYFGQNKPRNKANNFKVLESPHFELYHYQEKPEVTKDFLVNAENWYKLHQDVFKIAFVRPNPIILYNSHPDFQETTAIGGDIGEGTGGVTEGMRVRVVMPFMFTKRQTNHVLGHELVHAFQYQTMNFGSDSTSLVNIQNIPLFMVEGLAEYMSIGRVYAHTAMWMRDAVQSGDIPEIIELVNKPYKYFPYRWGQTFWAYVTAMYGDDIIRPLFKETAIYGIEKAFVRAFNMDLERFSMKFKNDLIQTYGVYKNSTETSARGTLLISEKSGADMNISPAISPNGRFLAYVSSKNVLSLDILIADATTGKTLKKIETTNIGSHVDSYSFIETSVTWSPDNNKIGIVIQSKSKNKLLIVDVVTGEKQTLEPKDVSAFTNPAWSPDGSQIAFSGLKDGTSDLYILNVKSGEIANITQDNYSDIQPTWAPDGKSLVFVSDRNSGKGTLEKENFKIYKIDLSSRKVNQFKLFETGDNMNPVFNEIGDEFYFLNNGDGFRNLYKYNLETNKTFKLTNFFTGISGITEFSPAISAGGNEVFYNYFFNGNYQILKANSNELLNIEITDLSPDNVAANLPAGTNPGGSNIVQNNLENQNLRVLSNDFTLKEKKYDAKFKLDYLANSGLGVKTSRFGTGMGGGVMALFTDMLNNNQLMGTVAMNGEIQDLGGQIYYLNQKRPLQFGASFSHIPYRFQGTTDFKILDTLYTANNLSYHNAEVKQRVNRLLIDNFSTFVFRPFSKYLRLELGASLNWYTFNVKEYPQLGEIGIGSDGNVYDYRIFNSGTPKKLNPAEYGLNNFKLGQVYTAVVGDHAVFGTVAPLKGYRYRFELAQYFGTSSYTSVLADYRKYTYAKPVTIATRFLYNGRLNPTNLDVLNQINPLYLGFPWNMHGFWGRALTNQQGTISQENLQGDQMLVGNFEVRLPFTGPEKLALIKFNYLPSDLNFFVDAGLVWSKSNKIGETNAITSFGANNFNFKTSPIVTTGLSLRVNVLGYVILEPYVALPFYNSKKQALVSGLNFMIAGW